MQLNRLSLNSRLYDFETATPIPTYLARSKDVANGFTALCQAIWPCQGAPGLGRTRLLWRRCRLSRSAGTDRPGQSALRTWRCWSIIRHMGEASFRSRRPGLESAITTTRETVMRIDEMIAAVQQELGVEVDGKAGPQTWGAIYERLVKKEIDGQKPCDALALVDSRSEKVIATLLPEVRPIARMLVQKASAAGIAIKIISGLRTYEEQNALYAQGRSAPGNIVTNARGGYSNHNFGIAFDVGVFEGNRYLPDSPKYKAVGALGVDLGLEWGGSWKTIVDQPHFQLRPTWAAGITEKQMLAELRSRHDSGQPVFA